MRKLFSLPAKILSWLLALSFIIACWGTEPDVPSPGPTPPNPTQDTKAPVISIKIQEQNVIAGVKVDIKTDQILFDQTVAATWKDDISKSCKVEVGFIGEGGAVKAIKSGDRLEEPGKLQIKVTDEAGNDSSAEIKLTRVDSWAPEISILIGEKNVVAGVKVKVEGNQLFLDDQMAASWKDDYSESLMVDIQHIPENSSTGKAIESGETLFDAGKLQIAVQDDAKNKSTAEIKLTSVAISGLESLMGKELTVDVPVNLLQDLTIAEGLTLQKVEAEQNGVRSEIASPEAYSPQIPGAISIILTLSRTDGSTIEVKVDNLTVKGIPYQAMKITDLKPVEILPIIGQIEGGDKNAYDHIEHLRVAEATRIRDMMWKYGTGKHSPEQYQQLMIFHQKHSRFPEYVVIYRQGGNEKQIQKIYYEELPVFKSFFSGDKNNGGYNENLKPKIAVIAVNKKTDLKFFQAEEGKNVANPPSGTVVDTDVTTPNYFEFYLQPQYVNQGTATPVHFHCIYDTTGMPLEIMESVTYNQTFYYWNWSGPIREPAALKFAEVCSQFYAKVKLDKVSENLMDSPYYI